MRIGRQIEIQTYEPKIIPIKLPEPATQPAQAPAVPEPERIAAPNWPQPERVTVPATPEKEKAHG